MPSELRSPPLSRLRQVVLSPPRDQGVIAWRRRSAHITTFLERNFCAPNLPAGCGGHRLRDRPRRRTRIGRSTRPHPGRSGGFDQASRSSPKTAPSPAPRCPPPPGPRPAPSPRPPRVDPRRGQRAEREPDRPGLERLLCVDEDRAKTYAAAPDVDQLAVMANSTKYGGAGYTDEEMAPSPEATRAPERSCRTSSATPWATWPTSTTTTPTRVTAPRRPRVLRGQRQRPRRRAHAGRAGQVVVLARRTQPRRRHRRRLRGRLLHAVRRLPAHPQLPDEVARPRVRTWNRCR